MPVAEAAARSHPRLSEPKTEGAAQTPAKAPLSALMAIVPYAARYRGRVFLALIALLFASGATLAVPLAVRRVIDIGFSPDKVGQINATFVGLVAVVGVLSLASASRYYLVMTLGERVVADLRSAVFAHLASLDARFFDTAKTGELVSRLTADTTQLKATFGASASVALRNFFLFIGAISMMIYTSPKLSALVLVAIPVIVLPMVFSGRSVRRRSRLAQDTLANATAFASENLGAVRIMQAYGEEGRTVSRFNAAVENSFDAARVATSARALLTGVAIFMSFASVVGVLWLGAHDVLRGEISSGLLSQFLLYAVLGASSLGELSQVWSEISAAAGAAGRLGEILAVRSAVAIVRPVAQMPAARGAIRFESVGFAYPSRPQDAAVRNLSFSVEPGEMVAIVGPSGAGKSTVLQLLLRFYDPDSGKIYLDGVDIRTADPADVRHRIALVPQESVIFGSSIADNIRYGSPQASDADVKKAAERAAADEFIRALPNGYETLVGERGVTLSGGQRQRLAIARAILKDAPILLLDEATSALDAENETLVQGALEKIMKERTTLVIAHRLATVLSANRILVMEEGQVVEEGTHETLVAKNGLYARLARLQFDTANGTLAAHNAKLN